MDVQDATPEVKAASTETHEATTSEAKLPEKTPEKKAFYPKKKIVVLVAYNGEGYHGLQMNDGVKTIEEDIEAAMYEAGLILPGDHKDLHKLSWQRSSRTDKGVSALGLVISFKAILVPDLVNKVNEKLPQQIRMLAYNRTYGHFDSKNDCTQRKYNYLIPTFAFAPSHTGPTLEGIPYAPRYKFTTERLQEIRSILKFFVGSHNFHNYTINKKPADASAYRTISSFTCEEPQIIDSCETVLLTVIGRSFMLHQIRKMIGTLISVVRGDITIDIFHETLTPSVIRTPMAPGLGLFLEKCYYDQYEKRKGEPLFDENEVYPQKMEFKDKFIIPHIIRTEKSKHVVSNWLRRIDLHPMGGNDDDISVEGQQQMSMLDRKRTIVSQPEAGNDAAAKRARFVASGRSLDEAVSIKQSSGIIDWITSCSVM